MAVTALVWKGALSLHGSFSQFWTCRNACFPFISVFVHLHLNSRFESFLLLLLLFLSGRTLRRTLVPKGLAVIAGLSAEAPISCRPRWTELSMMRGTLKRAKQRSSLVSGLFFFSNLLFVRFAVSSFGLHSLYNDLLYWVNVLKKGCELLIMFAFVATGLRAVWCPPLWQRLVVRWQETQPWVKIMLLLACITYLINMLTLLVCKQFFICLNPYVHT